MANEAFDAAIDHVKYLPATLHQVQGELASQHPHRDPESTSAAIEVALAQLSHAEHLLGHVVEAFCPHCAKDMGHYVDGRPTTSVLPLGDGTLYMHAWHPDRTHEANRPHEIDGVTTRDGKRVRLIVSAPGHLDSVTENIAGSTK